jgi:hypothetical protein
MKKSPEWVKFLSKKKWPEKSLVDTQREIAERFWEIQAQEWTMVERVQKWARRMSKLSDLEGWKPYFIDIETWKITYPEESLADKRDQKEAMFILWTWLLPVDIVANHVHRILGQDNLWICLLAPEERWQTAIDEIVKEELRDIFWRNPEFDKIMFELERNK